MSCKKQGAAVHSRAAQACGLGHAILGFLFFVLLKPDVCAAGGCAAAGFDCFRAGPWVHICAYLECVLASCTAYA